MAAIVNATAAPDARANHDRAARQNGQGSRVSGDHRRRWRAGRRRRRDHAGRKARAEEGDAKATAGDFAGFRGESDFHKHLVDVRGHHWCDTQFEQNSKIVNISLVSAKRGVPLWVFLRAG